MKMMMSLTIRLFLVRHGTTDANREGIIVGQSDSRLTVEGIQQAKDLGNDPLICKTDFWRKCTSDLCRAQQTAALILQLNDGTNTDDDSIVEKINVKTVDFSRNANIINTKYTQLLLDNNVLLETKIRETAKGVRQGYPKTMNVHEVMEEREKKIPDHYTNDDILVPILETTDDGWIRISSWLGQIISDAWEEESIQTSEIRTATNHVTTKNVLAVSHSGILRTFLSRLVGDTRLREHPDTQYDESNVLFIPNTSLTIIDVRITAAPSNLNSNNIQSTTMSAFQNYDERIGVHVDTADFGLTCDIIEMASIRHYQV